MTRGAPRPLLITVQQDSSSRHDLVLEDPQADEVAIERREKNGNAWPSTSVIPPVLTTTQIVTGLLGLERLHIQARHVHHLRSCLAISGIPIPEAMAFYDLLHEAARNVLANVPTTGHLLRAIR